MKKIITIILLFFASLAWALQFSLPSRTDSVIGQMQSITAHLGDNVNDLAQKYQVGYLEFQEANPNEDMNHLWVGKNIIVPSEFILPQASKNGIIINLAELRLYYFPRKKNYFYTFPIGIGRPQSVTPVGKTKIIGKEEDPIWFPTKDTIIEASQHGLNLPDMVPPGPENPLGKYAMRLGMLSDSLASTYLIHSTNDPTRVGLRSTGGCISMYPSNIEKLFAIIKVGTPVNIVDQPIKSGWKGDELFLEAHVPLTRKDKKLFNSTKYMQIAAVAIKAAIIHKSAEINWEQVAKVVSQQRGIPIVIGKALKSDGES